MLPDNGSAEQLCSSLQQLKAFSFTCHDCEVYDLPHIILRLGLHALLTAFTSVPTLEAITVDTTDHRQTAIAKLACPLHYGHGANFGRIYVGNASVTLSEIMTFVDTLHRPLDYVSMEQVFVRSTGDEDDWEDVLNFMRARSNYFQVVEILKPTCQRMAFMW